MTNTSNHCSQIEYLHQTVTNPNIIICGKHSYYSGAYTGRFQDVAVRYLYGDVYSDNTENDWQSLWHIDRLFIGDYVQISANVIFMMGGNNMHHGRFISTYPFMDKQSLQRACRAQGDSIVGNDVWIGTGAMIMPGVTLSDGAIIGAGSVVVEDVLPYTVVAGNPAKPIRKRFSEAEIEQLLALQWWYWPEEKVHALLSNLQQTSVHQLIAATKQYDQQEHELFEERMTKEETGH